MTHHLGESPAASVQLFQALVARELVEGFGTPLRRASELLGLVPSAISQYLSGKRLSSSFAQRAADDRSQRVAREVAQRLLSEDLSPGERTRLLLEGASSLLGLARRTRDPSPKVPELSPGERRELSQWLRRRVKAEQAAVSECMHLAQKGRDELTRAIFRQIASDSLRHAEIVASLASYLDRGVVSPTPTGVTRAEILHLIAAEEKAEAGGLPPEVAHLRGTMAVLLASMGADERKHDEILRELLSLDGAGSSSSKPRSPPVGRVARRSR